MLRPHASVFVMGKRQRWHCRRSQFARSIIGILSELHWQNAVGGYRLCFCERIRTARKCWDGIRMEGPYCWRPPNYWFSGKYPATFGSNVEQGDNEHIPTLESLKKFIPADKLWPDQRHLVHARRGVGRKFHAVQYPKRQWNNRYGPSTNVEDFVRKAQLAHYENTRAQFENLAASGWATHKMVGYWMLNSHWPSFYGNIIDYYLKSGRPLLRREERSAPALGGFRLLCDRRQQPGPNHRFQSNSRRRARPARSRAHLRSRWQGARRPFQQRASPVPFNGATQVMTLPRYPESSPVFFVRCQLFDDSRKTRRGQHLLAIAERRRPRREKDMTIIMTLRQDKWADMTALNTMPPVAVEIEPDANEDWQGEPRHHPFAQSLRAHRFFRAGHYFRRSAMATKSCRSYTTTITLPSFPAKPPRFTERFGKASSPAGSNSKDTILLQLPCLSIKRIFMMTMNKK